MGSSIDRSGKIWVAVLFGLYLLVGLWLHADYGVSWDEPISRTNGLVNLRYVHGLVAPGALPDDLKAIPELANWADKDYGVAFELPLVALERAFDVHDDRGYAFRHLVIFLFSFLGVVAIYKTARFVYGDYRPGVLAALLLVLSPRLFGESFYNSKDMVFMAAIAMAIYTFSRFVTRPRVSVAVLHGAVTAYAIDIRIMGIVMVGATLGVLLVRAARREMSLRQLAVTGLAFLATTALIVIALFPYLWSAPYTHFVEALGSMARFRWNNAVLYLGREYLAPDLPWHYLPVWILLTTPVVYSLLLIAGLVNGARTLLTNRLILWSSPAQMLELSYVALLLVPLVGVIGIHAVVYDGWRHLYFIYPAFVLVAVGGCCALFHAVRRVRGARLALSAALAVTFVANALWIARAHPLENVYFNVFAGRDWRDRFDLDYWGLGNHVVLEHLLRDSTVRSISIKANSATPLDRAVLSLPAESRARVQLFPPEAKPEFVLTNYRFSTPCMGACDLSDYRLYFQKKVAGEVVISVFRLRDTTLADTISTSAHSYPADVFRQLSCQVTRRYLQGGTTYVDVRIENAGSEPIAAASAVGTPIRVSWRFADARGVARGGWVTRADLPRDIPAGGSVTLSIPISPAMQVPGGELQVALVQEGVFWGHDVGIADASLRW
ncbi:MAG: glycosyltransferase family 39 protein [Luteibacter sp.]